MTTQHTVLIVGKADQIKILAQNYNHDIVFAANFGEAAEHLKRHPFDYVITAAVLPDDKTGMDILRFMRGPITKETGHCATVCHTETSCAADGKKWNIKPSLSANFTFAQFYHGTIEDCWINNMNQVQRCA